MDFSLTEEQNLLKNSVARYLRDAYRFEDYLSAVASPEGMKGGAWRQMADMGWLGLAFDDAAGGAGLGPIELLSLAEEFGRANCVEPYLANVVLAGGMLAGAGGDGVPLLQEMIAGREQLALACYESAGRYDPMYCETRAFETADGWKLSGGKTTVLNGPNAGALLVIARHAGLPADAAGLGLYRVGRAAAGLQRQDYPLLGGGVASDLVLQDVPAQRLGGEAGQLLQEVVDRAIAFTCADAVGAMQALLAKTLEYLKTRKQFDRHLASFQVLQHRMVDMFIEVEQSRSMIMMAMVRLQDPDARQRALAAAACKAYLHKSSKFVAQQAIQLHGGIGLTEELDVGHYFRRLTAFGTLFGDRRHQLQRVAVLQNAPVERTVADTIAA